MRTLLTTSRRYSSKLRPEAPGLVTKSTAPISSASSVTCAPSPVATEIITTGVGRSRIRLRRNLIPSIPGIDTSSVTTSGLSVRIFSRAS